MGAVNYTISIEQGSDYELPIQWLQGDVPVDLTGALIRSQIRQVVDSPDVLDDLNTENGRIVIGPDPGMFIMLFPASITETWDFSCAVYDVEVTLTSGNVTRIVMGSVTNSFEVTR